MKNTFRGTIMNIKKIFAAMAAMALLTSCGGKDDSDSKKEESTTVQTTTQAETTTQADTTENADTNDYVELSRQIAEDFVGGDIKCISDLLSANAKEQLSDEMLTQGLEQIISQSGKLKEILDTKSEKQMGMTVTTTRMCFEKGDLDLMLAFNKDGELEGVMFQPAQDENIEPQETDTYKETSVKVGDHELDGMLTMPKNTEKPPVVILIQGSGQHNMNEGSGETATFNELAHSLAAKGIATIRYNKRFFQFPELAGDNNYTIDEEVLEDADSAVKLAKSYADKDEVGNIFVLGHSLGGCLAPVIAQRNSDVNGIIAYAGTPRDLVDVIIDQISAQLEEAEDEAMKKSLQEVLDAAAIVKEGSDKSVTLLGWGYDYFYSLKDLKIGETAKSLDIPMLFLQGKDDIQVYADKDFPLWEELLKDKAGCSFKLYDGLGHFFNDEDGHINSKVIDDTAEFVLNNSK